MVNSGLSTKSTGAYGEALAKDYLIKSGLTFLTQNYRTKVGEIDLILRDRGVIVFVEVKTRQYLDQGLPEEAVTPRKLSAIKRVGEYYLISNHLTHLPARIDVVAIELTTNPPTIRHLVNVTG